MTLYVLLCEKDRIYVGMTNDLVRRWNEHKTFLGSEFTSRYKPIAVIDTREVDVTREEAEELEIKLANAYRKAGFMVGGGNYRKDEYLNNDFTYTIEEYEEIINKWDSADIEYDKVKVKLGITNNSYTYQSDEYPKNLESPEQKQKISNRSDTYIKKKNTPHKNSLKLDDFTIEYIKRDEKVPRITSTSLFYKIKKWILK